MPKFTVHLAVTLEASTRTNAWKTANYLAEFGLISLDGELPPDVESVQVESVSEDCLLREEDA